MVADVAINKKPAIIAIGTASPKYHRKQQDTADLIIAGLNLTPVEKRLLKSVYRATGIEQRYSVLNDYCNIPGEFEFFPNSPDTPFPSTRDRMKIYKENALPLALSAIENCLATVENSNPVNPDRITHLITVSCTGMYAPGIDIEIVQKLNLSPLIKRTAINFMGCYAAFNAIKVADVICKAEPKAAVLIVCVEICSIHFQKNMSVDNIIANSIFADGAAAIVIASNQTACKHFSLESFYCELLSQTNQSMTWEIADSGFDIILSSYVPDIIKSGIAAFVNNFLENQQLLLSDINYYAIHPGGIKILQACEEALNISKDDNKYSYEVLRQYGNMSSVTVLFVLKAMWDDLNHQANNKNIFSCAFGPGLTLESMILRSHNF